MNGPRPCDPEPVFELADGSLAPEREREIRAHLRGCSGCQTLYESELRLNASLGSVEFEETNSVCRGVAMALPTRSTKARLLWAALAVVLLLTTSVAMMLYGTNLAVLVIDAMYVFWGFVAGVADVIQVVFAAIGQALLVALAIGAFVDLVIAAVYLGVSRRRAREA
ncbi:MAG: zf-HC2 domain-containing protein [Rubrobacteraceae bacterium]|nr:zf-HC2 domain-containing protein [Rubrobacteraceae bacterium]